MLDSSAKFPSLDRASRFPSSPARKATSRGCASSRRENPEQVGSSTQRTATKPYPRSPPWWPSRIAPPDLFFDLPRPIQLYVGRVAVEKNIEAFLRNSHPGAKVVVGDGPALARLQAQFPQAHFLGKQTGLALAACYAGAEVFVFPSRTDTFGLVMIEALACGTPVAAFPVSGPLDVLTPQSGAMSERLEDAIAAALRLDREQCLAHGRNFSWEASADQFLAALEPELLTRPVPASLATVD
jgi:glycosyltransferase involved in cell wall biosynthesis